MGVEIEVLSAADVAFVAYVAAELEARREQFGEAIVLFPPANSYKRRLIHQVVEENFASCRLGTFSVGVEPRRRTAVGKKCPLPSTARMVPPSSSGGSSVRVSTQRRSERGRVRGGVYVPPHRREVPLPVAGDGSWDPLYCGKGVCSTPNLFVPILDDQEMREMVREFGRVRVVEVKGFAEPQPAEQDNEEDEEDSSGGTVVDTVEIYDLPEDISSDGLAQIFGDFVGRRFCLRWINGERALGVFSSPETAAEALAQQFDKAKVRPLSEASPVAAAVASHLVLPSSMRPRTCASLAKRLLSRALGPLPNRPTRQAPNS